MARHIYQAPLRWSDQDAYRHINNVMYLRYLEEARIDMLFLKEHPANLGDSDALVVARNEIDYKRVLDYRPRPVQVETWVSEIRAGSFTVEYDVLDLEPDGSRIVFAHARSKIVPMNLAEGRPIRITPEQRKVLETFQDD